MSSVFYPGLVLIFATLALFYLVDLFGRLFDGSRR